MGKIGTTDKKTNHPPGESYPVKTQWIADLYQQGKLDTPLAAAGIYKCLTPQLEAMVNRSSAYSGRQLREDFKKEHAAALQANVLPYRTTEPDVEAVAAWQAQYLEAQFRYYPLALWGESHRAKSKYIEIHLYPGCFTHKSVINWSGYNPAKHPAVLFYDVKDIFKIIIENKTAFQGAGDATFGASATNCHAITVDLLAKPIVVCCNTKPWDDSWISKNFHVVEVKESLVADPSASSSSCERSQSPKRLKKCDDADPPVKKAPAHYVFKGEPVPHSEASFAFD